MEATHDLGESSTLIPESLRNVTERMLQMPVQCNKGALLTLGTGAPGKSGGCGKSMPGMGGRPKGPGYAKRGGGQEPGGVCMPADVGGKAGAWPAPAS